MFQKLKYLLTAASWLNSLNALFCSTLPQMQDTETARNASEDKTIFFVYLARILQLNNLFSDVQ
jgi:hypothetical protein